MPRGLVVPRGLALSDGSETPAMPGEPEIPGAPESPDPPEAPDRLDLTGVPEMPRGRFRVEIIPFALRFRRPYVTAVGTLDRRESVLLRLRDENGITALGEGVPMTLRGGDDLATVTTELETWAHDPLRMPTAPPARTAIAIALADLEARRQGIPLWQHLMTDRTERAVPAEAMPGGRMPRRDLEPEAKPRALRLNATITAGPTADVVAQCETWAGDGFDVFKLKAGPEEAVELASAVRAALGPEVKIRLDANGTWRGQAAGLLTALETFKIELVEEPVTGLAELATLGRESAIPLVADESVNNPDQAARAAALGGCTAATVKLSKIGGLDATLGGHLPTYLSSALDGPVGIAAAAHAAQTLDPDRPWPDVAHGLATERLFSDSGDLSTSGPLAVGNHLTPPSNGPGLGLDLDEAALSLCRLD